MLKDEECGIRRALTGVNLFSGLEHEERETEAVMDRFVVEVLHAAGSARCPGRVLRRTVDGRKYRYQVQDESNTNNFGFSTASVEEDHKEGVTVVVFKKQGKGGKPRYSFWKWEWIKDGNKWKTSNRVLYVSNTKDRVVVNIPRESFDGEICRAEDHAL